MCHFFKIIFSKINSNNSTGDTNAIFVARDAIYVATTENFIETNNLFVVADDLPVANDVYI